MGQTLAILGLKHAVLDSKWLKIQVVGHSKARPLLGDGLLNTVSGSQRV